MAIAIMEANFCMINLMLDVFTLELSFEVARCILHGSCMSDSLNKECALLPLGLAEFRIGSVAHTSGDLFDQDGGVQSCCCSTAPS